MEEEQRKLFEYLKEFEYLNLNKSNALIKKYSDVISKFTSKNDNQRIERFLDPLRWSKIDAIYIDDNQISWTDYLDENDGLLNTLLKTIKRENLEKVSSNQYNIKNKNQISNFSKNKQTDIIFYIEDYQLLDQIYYYYKEISGNN